MINLYPNTCNICNGKVIYTSNADVYGSQYGSGFCYLCLECGAYVGTHKPRPREALGLLANEQMRKGKMLCHELFDKHWINSKNKGRKRKDMYHWLANKLGINVSDCHFGHFDLEMLRIAYKVLKEIEGKKAH